MTQMFTIPHNILLIFGFGTVIAVIGFAVYASVKGWKNVLPEYHEKKDEVTIDG